jgi:hypothetical protein
VTAQDRRDCLTAVLIAKRSEETLLGWANRLTTEHRRQVLALLIARSDQRAVDIWQDACLCADETA